MYCIVMMKNNPTCWRFHHLKLLFIIWSKLPGMEVPNCVKWYVSEDMMPFGGEYVMILKEFSRVPDFFYINQTQLLL